jgi:hypothetical protein
MSESGIKHQGTQAIEVVDAAAADDDDNDDDRGS